MTQHPPAPEGGPQPHPGAPQGQAPGPYAQTGPPHAQAPGPYAQDGQPQGYPGAPGAGPAGTTAPPEPKKNWFARHKILTGVLAVIALFVVVGLFSGGDDDDIASVAEESPGEPAEGTGEDEGAGTEDEEQDAADAGQDDDGAEDEEQDPAADDDAASDQQGTRDNPYPAGTAVEIGDYTVTLAETTTDAWEQIEAENQFNDPPADGRQFVMVPVTAAFDGEDTGWATMDLSIAFVGSGGNTFNFGSDDYCGVVPDSLSDQGEMYAGGSAEGNVCVSVDADQIEGGVWRVEETLSFNGDHAFIDLS